ncbi:MAG: hypothetical protein QGG42_03325 [Phycisphaerae bacterium]|jgi:hypothetical protein|nr:hypothetical protein [Phycisphaerae bacterium]
MKNMKNTRWIAIAVALIATLATAQAKEASSEPKIKTKHSAKAAKASNARVDLQVRKYAAIYNLSEDDQAKLSQILLAQQKDLADYEKVHGPKIKVVDDQIRKLQDEINKLQASKQVHAKALRELKLDHQAELNKAITDKHKTARVAASLKAYADAYWKHLPKEVQETLNRKCQAAAEALIASGDVKSSRALKDARTKLYDSIDKTLTPELRQSAETQYLQEYALRGFSRCELTDDQKTRIGELCARSVKDKVAMSQRYRQLSKDHDALRKEMYKYRGSLHFHEIRSEVAEKILTEEQRKRLPGKRRSTSKRDKSSRKKGDSGDRKGRSRARETAEQATL